MDTAFQLTAIEGLILGSVQGLTEFLPVSSTAHLILVEKALGFDEPSLLFNTVVQFASVLAIVAYFREDLLKLIVKTIQGSMNNALLFIVGTVPILVVGLLVRDVIEYIHSQLWVVGASLIGVGILMWIAQQKKQFEKTFQDLTMKNALLIGIFQSIALIPGVSRSGITIVGGLTQSLSFTEAIKFSFLLGIPAIAAATTYELLKLDPTQAANLFQPGYLLSFFSAFFVSLLSIHLTLGIVKKYQFTPFVIYRVVLGILTLLVWVFS